MIKGELKADVRSLEVSSADFVYGVMLNNYMCQPNKNFHTHENYHEFMFVLKGKIGNEVNNNQQIIEQMQVCFIRRDDVHRHFCVDNESVDVYNIGVPLNLFEETLKYLNIDFSLYFEDDMPAIISLHRNDFGSIKHKIELLQNTEYGILHGTIYKALLTEVLYLFRAESAKFNLFTFAPNAPDWFYKLVDVIRLPENFLGGLPRIIKVSGYSQSYLNRVLKKYLGITPTKMLNILKLDYAKKLLEQDNLKVIDVCYKCGFNNEAHFYREFKKQYGVTPGKLVGMQKLF